MQAQRRAGAHLQSLLVAFCGNSPKLFKLAFAAGISNFLKQGVKMLEN
jgi:hypothetical protein